MKFDEYFKPPQRNWLYDIENVTIIWVRGAMELNPHEALAFGLMDKMYPECAPTRVIIGAFYPDHMIDADVPDDPSGVVKQTISRLRKRFMDHMTPFSIPQAHYNIGYKLWPEPQTPIK